MITINKDLCIGCGSCVSDCFPDVIDISGDKAVATRPDACISCGHCSAVCPTGAISIDGYDMGEVLALSKDVPSPSQLMNLIKQRRSTRRFRPLPVSDEQTSAIIEAGRYTPTARNLQGTSYIVVKDTKTRQTIRGIALERLALLAQDMLKSEDMALRGRKLIAMRDDFVKDPDSNDRLFFSAPLVILVLADKEGARDAAAASQSMELMASALGLGALFSGYFVAGAAKNSDLKNFLGISPDREVIRCMVIGYPDVNYLNTAPRKAADVRTL